jgi:hypothetical protein
MRLFVWPATDRVDDPDAVVLFVGGRGERLETALELVRKHNVDALVIPNGTDPTWPLPTQCATSHSSSLSSVQRHNRTRPAVKRERSRNWRRRKAGTVSRWSPATITLSRARLLLSRCFDGDVAVVRADPRLGPLDRAVRIAHAWTGLAPAHLIDRSC